MACVRGARYSHFREYALAFFRPHAFHPEYVVDTYGREAEFVEQTDYVLRRVANTQVIAQLGYRNFHGIEAAFLRQTERRAQGSCT